ncbi:Protein DEFECTIVE IN MERISTEM SILENCING 3 [Abeliophyllum distichum]|uniref:Protein DEFECTIVE IN MERISTEM SILENCING 3 n=1 Tax=Abeliophyllum distichum TaxID=126358 RepID=A0ABD1VSB2_9LAMI
MGAMERMPLMKSAVYEALRIKPPVASQYAKAKWDFVVESHDASFRIKEGEILFGFQPFATKDPRIFHRPEEFLPDSIQSIRGNPSALRHAGQNMVSGEDMQNGTYSQQAEYIVNYSKKLQDDLQALGQKIKHYEDNVKCLKAQQNRLEESILDMQVVLGKYHTTNRAMENMDHVHVKSEDETIEHMLRHEKSAAAILCQLKTHHGAQASNLQWTKDVVGIVATLGKVDDDNLSRLLSGYLGLETMLAVVCKTHEGPVDAPFLVFCLESLSPYVGEFMANDPQRRLDLLKPRLPDGEPPFGFLGFAVNMITIDSGHLHYISNTGNGLRETLFYNLFLNLQVYKSREDMLKALPCITNGAISLDGGMVRRPGVFPLGNRGVIDVKFPKSSEVLKLHENYFETEKRMKETNWKKERMWEDMQREQALLDHAKFNYEIKKREFFQFVGQSSSYTAQHTYQAGRSAPR